MPKLFFHWTNTYTEHLIIDEQAMKNSAKGFLSIVHYYLVPEDA